MNVINSGILLVSDPFLQDPNFMRSVVLICEHDDAGSLGFVMNKLYEQNLGELVEALEGCEFPVFNGGPVQPNTLHFLHTRPDLIDGGIEIIDGIFWGGDFDKVVILIQENILPQSDIQFYIGYSGWGKNQLNEEITEGSWLTYYASKKIIFYNGSEPLWKRVLKEMGGEYAQMINYPINPQLN